MVAVVLAVAVAHSVVGIAAARIAVDTAELLAVVALPLVVAVAAQLQRAVHFPEIQTQNRVVFGQMLVAALLVRVCVLLAFAPVKLVVLLTIRLRVKIHKDRPAEAAAEEYCR